MDVNQNRVTSVEQFRDELQGLLQRAKQHLERDDGLANVVLLMGEPSRQIFSNLPTPLLNQRLKEEVRHGSYESAIFVGLALARGGTDEPVEAYRATHNIEDLGPLTNATYCIVVEGAHRDFGTHATHWEFKRDGAKRFTFGRSQSAPLKGGVVADLWPKRRLNG